MARGLAGLDDRPEREFATEFEDPALLTFAELTQPDLLAAKLKNPTPDAISTLLRAQIDALGNGTGALLDAYPGGQPSDALTTKLVFDLNVILRTVELAFATEFAGIVETTSEIQDLAFRRVRMDGNPTLDFNNAASTITRSQRDWTDEGYGAGDKIFIEGSSSNDGIYTILSIGNNGRTLTVGGDDLVTTVRVLEDSWLH